jgi:hypothetical protein
MAAGSKLMITKAERRFPDQARHPERRVRHAPDREHARLDENRGVDGWAMTQDSRRLKRGVFTSIVELQAAIDRFIVDANGQPKPFVGSKSADAILAAVTRGRPSTSIRIRAHCSCAGCHYRLVLREEILAGESRYAHGFRADSGSARR